MSNNIIEQTNQLQQQVANISSLNPQLTYSYIVRDAFYALVPTEFKQYYYNNIRACAGWYSGFVPEFICLDINMPGVDGFEILRYLRREPRLIPVPVFVITSDDQPETRSKVMKLGANVLIIKPATIDALEDALKKVRFLK